MNFSLSEDHETIRRSAANFLDREIDLSPLLKPGATVADAGYDATWSKMAALGWAGLVIPEQYGGSALTCVDLVMIIREMGRTLAPSPFFGTLAGTWALLKSGCDEQKERILPAIASGEQTLAFAVCDRDGSCDGPGSDAQASTRGDAFVLNGSKSFVVDAGQARKVVVAAEFNGRRALFLVDTEQLGVSKVPLPWRDITRQVADMTFKDAEAELLVADDAIVWPWVRDRLQLLLSTENAAGLQTVLETTADYAKERVAFGRPIGAYQAIKHSLADMFGQSECANVAVLYASWMLSEEQPKAALSVAMAKSYTSDAYVAATHKSIQIFGAIGFTWEMKNHLYFKRARANAELFGSPVEQRSRVIDLLKAAA